MIFTHDTTRLALLAALSLSYAGVCLAPWLRARAKRRASDAARAALANSPAWLVAYASQTGNAEELATQTAQSLRLAGIPVRLCALADVTAKDLQQAERALFLVSTYGEGDAPDNAAAFMGRLMTGELALPQLHYAVLALGDRSYGHYCGFGRALDAWLAAQGASRLFERIEVDRSASAAIEQWFQHLSHLAGTSDAPDWSAPAFGDWRLTQRRHLNPGSAGGAIYHVELAPVTGSLPDWQSGDLVQVTAPADPSQPREYSIASIPHDGGVHLLVRQHAHPDGSLGLASGWLTAQAKVGDVVQLRLRQHKRFRLEDNARRPLILIGNGSGIAGLRGHLKSRVMAGQRRNWLIFGERNLAHDFHYREEIERWHASGDLPRLDLAFSRDQAERTYVQDRLRGNADEVKLWLEQGAAIYICGSLAGMAGGVDQALQEMLGRPALDALAAEGRYRRDVY
ncbi:sulfite reductase subunit alpha [Janthinobacterium sp. PLB04]|uniref:NADPH--hemoprotein reductase n=1 Tax=Janthinobacterium lividum TaxID=29581 RepID=A0AAJ4MQT1_9BURK|nr:MULTISPECIES: sulfite reductase subunit alpha [Janthinobacterium]KAB0326299.1 oxidoreductase [Janthinobacterium lividum]QSX95425.1 flavodoxin domain-containing protein [Janthinobacterium lividum]UGQ35261.1 sulfite reductase subunit alpha [Janthinobacterium sp. PLB04]